MINSNNSNGGVSNNTTNKKIKSNKLDDSQIIQNLNNILSGQKDQLNSQNTNSKSSNKTQENPVKKGISVSSAKCKNCGDDMAYFPEHDALVCPSCKNQKKIEFKLALPKHNFTNNTLTNDKNHDWASKVKVMECPNCGSTTTLGSYQTTAICQYCDTPLVTKTESFTGLKPDAIIPFKFGKAKAEELFKEKMKSKWWAPKKFKKSITADNISSFYFPAFVFQADCVTKYVGRVYDNVETRDSDGSTTTTRRYRTISGSINTNHSDVEVEASTHLTQYDLNNVRPYNLASARLYTDDYIYGYSLENYSSSVNESYGIAKNMIEQDIRRQILSLYVCDGVDYLNMTVSYFNEQYSYCVLPMYRINYKHKNKTFTNVMNGQTAKLGGKYPKSGLKIFMVVMLSILAFAIPITLAVLSSTGSM